jgi:hypothetical protein
MYTLVVLKRLKPAVTVDGPHAKVMHTGTINRLEILGTTGFIEFSTEDEASQCMYHLRGYKLADDIDVRNQEEPSSLVTKSIHVLSVRRGWRK